LNITFGGFFQILGCADLDVFLFGLTVAERRRPALIKLARRRSVGQLGDVAENTGEGVVIRPPVEEVLPGPSAADRRVRPRPHHPEVVVLVVRVVEPRPRSPVLFVGRRQFVEDHATGDVVGAVGSVGQVFVGVVQVVLVVLGASERIVAYKKKCF
jgi:hypothetical protein